jgi:hypothetical protein
MNAWQIFALFVLALVSVQAFEHGSSQHALQAEATDSDTETETETEEQTDATLRAELDLAKRLGERVHHKWGLWGFPNDKVHEDIVDSAFGMLSSMEKAVFNQGKFTDGVRFPDMPCRACDGTYLDSVPFLADFKLPSNRRQLVYNSHYGCLQHWHSQGSVMVPADLSNPDGANRIVFSNTDLKGFMIAQAEQWWNLARATSSKDSRTWNLGRLLHIVADSFPRGHTLRDNTNTYPYGTSTDPYDPAGKGKTMATACGKIWYFQGYDAQKGQDAHAAADKQPTPGHQDYNRLQCAKYYSWKLMRLMAQCGGTPNGGACAWSNAKIVLDEVWQLASWSAGRKTAGSVAAFAGPGLSGKGYQSVSYNLGTTTVNVWEPTSAKLWSSASGYQSLCPPIVGKATTLGYKEDAFTDFNNPTKGTSPGAPVLVDCYQSKSGGAVYYQHPSGDCKKTNLIMSCQKNSECAPNSQGCSGGVCKCQDVLPANTCRCLKPHAGYPQVCKTESYSKFYA